MNVIEKLNSYPDNVRIKLSYLRNLIYEVANEEEVEDLVETLKWGQISYLSKHGSTVRIGWKMSCPDEYGMYFHCQTKLVSTFREIYREQFRYEENRAIIFKFEDLIAEKALKHCVLLSLRYHKVKKMPLLGA